MRSRRDPWGNARPQPTRGNNMDSAPQNARPSPSRLSRRFMDQLYFVVDTHWDREWYQPFQQMRARLVAMADRMIPLVERGTIPFFHFDGQTIVLEDYIEVRPHAERRLRALVRAGKIQIGPWYVLADSFLVSGESLIRNLEIGIANAGRFGRPLELW